MKSHIRAFCFLIMQFMPFLLFCCLAGYAGSFAQTANQDSVIESLKKEAEENYQSFKNGPAFDALVNYANLKFRYSSDSAQKALTARIAVYSDSLIRQQDAYMKLISESALLKQQTADLKTERNRLLRNAAIYVLLIAGAGIAFLLHKRKKLKQEEIRAEESVNKLRFLEEYNQKAETLQQAAGSLRFSFASATEVTSGMQEKADKIRSLCVTLNMHVADFDMMAEHLMRIHASAATAVESIDHFNSFFEESARVKSVQNLNPLLDDMVHLALLWVQSEFPMFECKITKDLEKILPDMEFQPHALRIAFFHLFCHAFQSVAEKAAESSKGFKPQVTVSSRKLPRFIQVRIRNNGKGIPLKNPAVIFEPFFTVYQKPFNAGLGLHEASVILKEMHRAEIIIESDAGSGTDFLIRFPFNR